MLLHRGKYFWVRAIFQIIAFSFLSVTILMLINFGQEVEFWHRVLAMLAARHCLDFVTYTLDLVAFSRRNLDLLKWKIPLDIISLILIIAVQGKVLGENAIIGEAAEAE